MKKIPSIVKTTAGNLPSQYVIHVYLQGPDKVKKMTQEILQLAEKERISSISFPALGTGKQVHYFFLKFIRVLIP